MNQTLASKTISNTDAIRLIQNGGVGVLATDTVYGVVASAHNREAVARLYALKQRERKPGTIVAASTQQLVELGIQPEALAAVEKWWPNPLSVIVEAGEPLFYVHQGLDSLPLRIPKDERLRDILTQTGPLVTSSANQPGEPESTNLTEAWNYFGDQVDFYVDAGDRSGRAPSTLIRISNGSQPEVLRQGAFVFDNSKP